MSDDLSGDMLAPSWPNLVDMVHLCNDIFSDNITKGQNIKKNLVFQCLFIKQQALYDL